MEHPLKFGLHRSLRIRHHAAPRFWIGRACRVEVKVPESMKCFTGSLRTKFNH